MSDECNINDHYLVSFYPTLLSIQTAAAVDCPCSLLLWYLFQDTPMITFNFDGIDELNTNDVDFCIKVLELVRKVVHNSRTIIFFSSFRLRLCRVFFCRLLACFGSCYWWHANELNKSMIAKKKERNVNYDHERASVYDT